MSQLFRKTVSTIKHQGLGAFYKKAQNYIGKKLIKSAGLSTMGPIAPIGVIQDPGQGNNLKARFVDVLFINGCGSAVPHPARYRVTHQREQLTANNISSEEVYYENLHVDQVKYAHLFVFFRCPYTDTIGEFINLAKTLNKTVLFDIDDLVIDTKYTDQIKYVDELRKDERALYDNGVMRMGRTLRLCEGAITTTERLAEELGHYVPEVYINRNTASERMYELSENVKRDRNDDEVRIGYFSGSITHNDDFKLVMPAIVTVLEKYANVRLYIVGELELPEELKKYQSQIVVSPFLDWQELPQLISSVDINIAPLEDTIFNEAKSENKWVEAALVKVVTVASNVGAFKRMILHEQTGFLCDTVQEWTDTLEKLINDEPLRKKISQDAYAYVKENCLTIYTGYALAKHIKEKMRPSVALMLPSTEISGGIMVALKHAKYICEQGYDVTIIASNPSLEWVEYEDRKFPVLSYENLFVEGGFDKAIATMWCTLPLVITHPKIMDRYYLVQGFEVDLYNPGIHLRLQANQTYNVDRGLQYLTISKWCQNWLEEKYEKKAKYAPNGIDTERFYPAERSYDGKIRILIEGDCAVDYKRVDESFEITNQLPSDKYEIWYMSYNETPKSWYRVDKFLHRVPYDKVADVYRQCHILIKSSILESFSYPPLEMMATGGLVVVVQNGGNSEYIRHEENCLVYESGEPQQAIDAIQRLSEDDALRKKLSAAAVETAKRYEWENIRSEILALYGIAD